MSKEKGRNENETVSSTSFQLLMKVFKLVKKHKQAEIQPHNKSRSDPLWESLFCETA